jgi:leucyl-tRNA synthetase
VYYKDGMPYTVDEKDLPITLPEVKDFKPTADGRPH